MSNCVIMTHYTLYNYYLMLRATLLRLMAPSTESWSNETVSSRNVPRYLFIRYLPALFLKASEKLVYQADQAILHAPLLDGMVCFFTLKE